MADYPTETMNAIRAAHTACEEVRPRTEPMKRTIQTLEELAYQVHLAEPAGISSRIEDLRSSRDGMPDEEEGIINLIATVIAQSEVTLRAAEARSKESDAGVTLSP